MGGRLRAHGGHIDIQGPPRGYPNPVAMRSRPIVGFLFPVAFLVPLAGLAVVYVVTHWWEIVALGIFALVAGFLKFYFEQRAKDKAPGTYPEDLWDDYPAIKAVMNRRN